MRGGNRGASSDTVISEQVNKSENLKPHKKKFPKVFNLALSDYLYLSRYWAICVLHLFVNQAVMS